MVNDALDKVPVNTPPEIHAVLLQRNQHVIPPERPPWPALLVVSRKDPAVAVRLAAFLLEAAAKELRLLLQVLL